MDDTTKSKEQLIDELVKLRQVISSNTVIEDEKAKTNSILEGLGVGLIIQDLNYKVIYENKYQQDTVGNHVGEFCYAAYEGKDHICEDCPMVLSLKDREVHRTERMITTEEGNRYYELISSPLINSAGNITGGVKLVKDISLRKRIEEDLREREYHLQTIIQTEPECVKIISGDGTLLDMNPAGLRMIQADSFDQVNGKSVYPLVTPEHRDAFRELTESVYQGNHGSLEFEIIGLKGTHRWLETTAVPFRNAQNKIIGILGVTRDITEHKKALEEIKQLNKELEELLYTTSHDLRTPLVNIHGYSREFVKYHDEIRALMNNGGINASLKGRLAPLFDEISESIQYIDSSIYKMESLLSGLLKLSRTGRAVLTIESLDMNTLTAEINKEIEFQVKEAGAEVLITELPSCHGDRLQISRVFTNLLVNALHYLKEEVKGVIKVSGFRKSGYSVYCVEDNGIGISPEYQKKIFNIFSRLDPKKSNGEGVGLSIVKKIVEMHRGKVWVESELNKGSKFFVSLPS